MPDDLRIADADREKAISELSRHTGDGRLTLDEFEERVDEVLNAKTRADLRTPFRGLPAFSLEPARARRPRVDVAAVVRPIVMLVLLVLAVVTMGAWVLFVAVWFVPRLFHGPHPRHHHRERLESARGDDLTLV